MIIIFNIMGAVVGLSGLLLGFVLLVATGSVTLGMVGVAIVWCYFGRSKTDSETGQKGAAPSVFFIPLLFWGILAALAVFPAALIDYGMAQKKLHPELGAPSASSLAAEQFKSDEAGLKTNESDDPELSAALVVLISKVLPGIPVNVRVKSSADSVLILMKLPDLKKIRDEDRKELLESIRVAAEEHRTDVKTYIGIKGRFVYGAISTPDRPSEVGAAVLENKLFGFYKSVATPENAPVKSGSDEPSETVAADSNTSSLPVTPDSQTASDPAAKPASTSTPAAE